MEKRQDDLLCGRRPSRRSLKRACEALRRFAKGRHFACRPSSFAFSFVRVFLFGVIQLERCPLRGAVCRVAWHHLPRSVVCLVTRFIAWRCLLRGAYFISAAAKNKTRLRFASRVRDSSPQRDVIAVSVIACVFAETSAKKQHGAAGHKCPAAPSS